MSNMTPEQEAAMERCADFMARMYFKYGVNGINSADKPTKKNKNGEKDRQKGRKTDGI